MIGRGRVVGGGRGGRARHKYISYIRSGFLFPLSFPLFISFFHLLGGQWG